MFSSSAIRPKQTSGGLTDTQCIRGRQQATRSRGPSALSLTSLSQRALNPGPSHVEGKKPSPKGLRKDDCLPRWSPLLPPPRVTVSFPSSSLTQAGLAQICKQSQQQLGGSSGSRELTCSCTARRGPLLPHHVPNNCCSSTASSSPGSFCSVLPTAKRAAALPSLLLRHTIASLMATLMMKAYY